MEIAGLVSITTIAVLCLFFIALRNGFLVTLLAAMCGAALGFVGAMATIFVDIIQAIDSAVRAIQ